MVSKLEGGVEPCDLGHPPIVLVALVSCLRRRVKEAEPTENSQNGQLNDNVCPFGLRGKSE